MIGKIRKKYFHFFSSPERRLYQYENKHNHMKILSPSGVSLRPYRTPTLLTNFVGCQNPREIIPGKGETTALN